MEYPCACRWHLASEDDKYMERHLVDVDSTSANNLDQRSIHSQLDQRSLHDQRIMDHSAMNQRAMHDQSMSQQDINQQNMQNQINNSSMYTSVQKKTELHHIIDKDSTDSGAEMYSMDDLPRITSLNDEEVHSIDSTMLEEDSFATTDTPRSGYGAHRHYSQQNLLSAGDDYHHHGDRRMSHQRRASAVNAARRMSTVYNAGLSRSEDNMRTDRRISIMPGGVASHTSTPSTMRRGVNAFGEITVMPVGDYESDEQMRISVEEELYR